MQKSFIEDFFERMNEKLFFLLVIFIQLVFIFQGLDFTDSGFDAVFYQRIFSDPSSVQYNFTCWLTGIIGGGWLKLFPEAGLLGLRIAGVICTTLTFGISYRLLKKYLQTGPLRLGLFLIILFLATSVKELNPFDISALFFMCAAWFLFTGLTDRKYYRLFIAGIFIAVNMFARLSNVWGVLLMLVIWFSGYQNRIPFRKVFGHSLLFIGGFSLITFELFLVMRSMHHDIFLFNDLNLLRRINNQYGSFQHVNRIARHYFVQYGEGLMIAIVGIVTLWSFAGIWRRLKAEFKWMKGLWPIGKYLILTLLTGLCIYASWRNENFWFYLFLFYAGTSLIIGFLMITGRQPKDIQVLAAIGCIMLLVLPIGSHFELMTQGKYAIWIIVPITVDYLLNIRSLSSSVVVSENSRHTYEQIINASQMDSLRNGFIFLTLTYILSVCYFYPHFDLGNRMKMKYEVHNAHVAGIYTTPERARTVSELLLASGRYVKPNDYVLAYDGLPMYYFLTDTRPFIHNSWPRLYTDSIFREELEKSLRETHFCPVVIIQKGSMTGNNWPEQSGLREKPSAGLEDFLKKYQYRQVWENDFFRMVVPAFKNLPVSSPGSLTAN
jgi:general stress protein CsbA